MPTLDQLPQAVAAADGDLLLIGQDGQTRATSIGVLLDPVQRRLTLAPGVLLGRASPVQGGPEPVGIGPGLRLDQGALEADIGVLAGLDSPSFSGRPTAPTLADDDDSDALATTSFVQRHTSKATPVQAVAGKTGFVVLNANDVSGIATVGKTGAYADLTGRPAADHFNVMDFAGAVADGVTHTAGAINAAITAANARPSGGEVFIPAGVWRIDMVQGYLLAKSNVVLRGAGAGKTVIFIDDGTTAPGKTGLSNQIAGGSFPKLSRFQLRDLTFQGSRVSGLTVPSGNITAYAAKSFLVNLYNFEDIVVEDCEFIDSTSFSLAMGGGTGAVIRGNRVARSTADSIALWDVANAIVTDNRIEMSGDDSISAHTGDATAGVPRSGLVISNNSISDGPGIHVLGAKIVSITGNVIRRSWGGAIKVGFDPFHAQGNTANFAVSITDNVITDVFAATGWNPFATSTSYIRVGGSSRQKGAGASAPGMPSPAGAFTPLLGTGAGSFYANRQFNSVDGHSTPASTVPAPGGAWLRIEGNTLARTLPAVSAWSDWGYGAALETGVYGGFTGAVSEVMMAQNGIHLIGTMANSRITGNLIQTTGDYSLYFDPSMVDFDYDDTVIEGNTFADFRVAGMWFGRGSPAASTRLHVRQNIFNADPFFRHSLRNANGTWQNGSGLVGIYAAWVNGIELERNHFQNLCVAVASQGGGAAFNARGNVVRCHPVATGFNAGNAGVANIPAASAGWTHTIEGCDPTQANWGTLLGPTLISAAAMPTSGRFVAGHFVQNSAAAPASGFVAARAPLLRGWLRLTTGAGHVLGTDWEADWSAPGDATTLSLASGGLLDWRGGDGAITSSWNQSDQSFNFTATGGANSGGLLRIGYDGSLRAGGNVMATQAFASGLFATPPALGTTTPNAGTFTTLIAGGATPSVSMGGDGNGNISLGRAATAGTAYIDFRGNNIASGFSVRMIGEAANQLSLVGASGTATLRVYGGVVANTMTLGGAAVATQSFVTAQGYESTANKGIANGYAALDGTGKVPTSQLPASVLGALNYQGAWNAATNSPTLVSSTGTKGFYYTVSVAGSTVLDGLSGWQVGDHVAFNGTKWESFDSTASEVISVAGRTGVVTLSSGDIAGLGSLATQSAGAVAITGGNVNGLSTLSLANPAGSGVAEGVAYSLSAPAGKARQIFVQTSGSSRWALGAGNTAETGGNAGSDFALARFSDAGALIDTPLLVSRATGSVQVGAGGLSLSGSPAASQAWVAAQGYEQPANRGQPNGYASLDGAGLIPTSQLPAAVLGSLNYQGAWNALANSPALASGTGSKGFYYTVSHAGTTALDGVAAWDVGDHVAFNGVAWEKFDGPAPEVISVAGRSGVVSLTTADIGGLGSLASQSAGAVAITGGSVANLGTLSVSSPVGSQIGAERVALSSPAGQTRHVFLQTAGGNRWSFGASNGAESGGNTGTDFGLARYSDAGAFIDNPLSISRATGVVSVGGAPVATQAYVTAQGFELASKKGAANGYAGLDATARLPAAQLPVAVVSTVAGRSGAVSLTTADIGGLGSLATQAASAVAITGGSATGLAALSVANAASPVALGAGGLTIGGANAAIRPTVTVFTANGSFTPRATTTSVSVVLVGGGGGGGFGAALAAGASGSGGGGGGGAAMNVIGPVPAASLPASLSVTVGAGGTGGVSGTPDGGQGGATSVTATGVAWWAPGGGGGARGAAAAGSGGGGGGCYVNAGGSTATASGGGGGSPFGAAGGAAGSGAHSLYPTAGSGGAGCSATGVVGNAGFSVAGGSGGGSGAGFASGVAGASSGFSGAAPWANAAVKAGHAGQSPPVGAGAGGGGGSASASANGMAGGAGGRGGGGGGGAAALAGFTPGNGGAGGAGQVVFIEW